MIGGDNIVGLQGSRRLALFGSKPAIGAVAKGFGEVIQGDYVAVDAKGLVDGGACGSPERQKRRRREAEVSLGNGVKVGLSIHLRRGRQRIR